MILFTQLVVLRDDFCAGHWSLQPKNAMRLERAFHVKKKDGTPPHLPFVTTRSFKGKDAGG